MPLNKYFLVLSVKHRALPGSHMVALWQKVPAKGRAVHGSDVIALAPPSPPDTHVPHGSHRSAQRLPRPLPTPLLTAGWEAVRFRFFLSLPSLQQCGLREGSWGENRTSSLGQREGERQGTVRKKNNNNLWSSKFWGPHVTKRWEIRWKRNSDPPP